MDHSNNTYYDVPNENDSVILQENLNIQQEYDTAKQNRYPFRNHFGIMWKLCLAYAICYTLFAYECFDGIGSGIFALISEVFILIIAGILIQEHKKNNSLKLVPKLTIVNIFYLTMATALSFANCMTDNPFFLFFNHVGCFLLFCVGCIKLFYKDKLWDFGKYIEILFMFFVKIFASLPMPFYDYSHNHPKKAHKKFHISATTKYIILGLVIGLPILLLTTVLLASADRVFSDFLSSIFNLEYLANWLDYVFLHIIDDILFWPWLFIIYLLLLYLVMGSLSRGGLNEAVREPHKFQDVVAITIFTMIDIVYVIFSGIQFIYLFAGFPSAKYTYAEYAREGFFQLLFVALINFILVLFCNKHFAKNIVLKIVMTITCLCTFVMIVSSAYRMALYIEAYHLTFLRVLVLWFLSMLAFLMLGSMISIYVTKWNSFRYSLFIVTFFYTGFALSNVDAFIANYNMSQYEKALVKNTDEFHIPDLYQYLPENYNQSMQYATELDRMYNEHYDQLGEHNQDVIRRYFSENYENKFYNLDLELSESAYLYDDNCNANPLSIKHFNLVEAKAYDLYKSYYKQFFSKYIAY